MIRNRDRGVWTSGRHERGSGKRGTRATRGACEALEGRLLLAGFNNAAADEGNVGSANVLTFSLTFRVPPEEFVTVNYFTANGTATAGTDYQARSGSFGLSGGVDGLGRDYTRTVQVPLVGDARLEPHETVLLNFNDEAGRARQAVGTIRNDEPTVTVTSADAAAGEDALLPSQRQLAFTFTISRALAAGDSPMRLNYATADGATNPARAGEDYAATSGTLTFVPGGAAAQTVVVPVLQDVLYEGAETLVLNVSTPDAGALVVPDAQFVGTISSNDPGVRVSAPPAPVYEGDPTTGAAQAVLSFPVSLTRALARGEAPVTIGYITTEGTATNGLDYAGTAGVLTFTAGGEATQNVTVPVRGDFDKEPALLEDLFLNLAPAGSGHVPVPGQEKAKGVVRDDDDPDSAWLPVMGSTVSEATPASSRHARFVLNGQNLPPRFFADNPQIYYTTEDPGAPPSDVPRATPNVDYTPQSGVIDLDPDPPPLPTGAAVALTPDGRFERNFARRAVVTVPVLNDAAQEPTERIHLVLRAGGAAGRVISRADAWLVDDDYGGTLPFPTTPGARFDWSMPDRFGLDGNDNQIIDMPTSRKYAARTQFTVNLDAATYTRGAAGQPPDADDAFQWTVEGEELAAPLRLTGGKPAAELPEGLYVVTLDAAIDGAEFTTTQTMTVQDHLVVAFGESAASGEGNPDRGRRYSESGGLLEDDHWGDGYWHENTDAENGDATKAHRRHHRTSLAGSAQAALELERADPRSSVTYVLLAQSGASTYSGLLGKNPSPIEPKPGDPTGAMAGAPAGVTWDGPQVGQAEFLAGGRQVDVLTLSLGGNDVGFSDVLTGLMIADKEMFVAAGQGLGGLIGAALGTLLAGPLGGAIGAAIGSDAGADEATEYYYDMVEDVFDTFDAKLQTLKATRYPAVAAALNRSGGLNPARVLMTEYPDPTRDDQGNFASEAMHDLVPALEISREELELAYARVVQPLNQAVADGAAANGWTLVDGAAEAFRRHGYSAFDNYMWTNDEAVANQGADKLDETEFLGVTIDLPDVSTGVMHPNEKGHQVYAKLLAEEMRRRSPDAPAPTVSIADAQRLEGNGGASELAFTVTLSAPLSRAVTLRYSTADGTAAAGGDYVHRSGTLVFAPDTTVLTLRIPLVPDLVEEPDETLRVNLATTSESAVGVIIVDGEGVGTIIDDEGGTPVRAPILGRHVFYNNSAFDGNDPAAGAADDAAVATDKQALLAGAGAATFANVTSYVLGINGVMVDMGRVPAGVTLGPGDFSVRTAAGASPGAWTPMGAAAAPSVTMRRGAGAEGSDRVTLTFADNAIRNGWVEVTVLAGERTGLGAPQAFYFGNQVGDTGEGNLSTAARVNAIDVSAVKQSLGSDASVVSTRDFNRDGKVNALDLAAVKANLSRSLPPFAPPAAPAAALSPAGATALLQGDADGAAGA